jgi:hypothetical protein
MEQPPTRVVDVEVDRHLTSMPGHDDRVFDRIADLEEVAVKVHRVNDWTLTVQRDVLAGRFSPNSPVTFRLEDVDTFHLYRPKHRRSIEKVASEKQKHYYDEIAQNDTIQDAIND